MEVLPALGGLERFVVLPFTYTSSLRPDLSIKQTTTPEGWLFTRRRDFREVVCWLCGCACISVSCLAAPDNQAVKVRNLRLLLLQIEIFSSLLR